jgi:membrane associated rhomboid family serine protease
MLPLYDNIRSRRFPVMNWILIGLNLYVFLYILRLEPSNRERMLYLYGMIPANLDWFQPITWTTLFTSMFLHAGWFHLLSNMWTLYIFGDNIEDRLGSIRYLIFYLIGGIIAGLMQAYFFQNSRIPAIGASGAIAGVLGGYFLLFPRARVITLIPIFIFPWLVEIPALVYLGFWFFSQLYTGVFSLSMPAGADMAGIAWWAHIGGFIFGVLFVRFFRSKHTTVSRTLPSRS